MTEMQSPNLSPPRGPSVWDRKNTRVTDWLSPDSAGRWMMGAAGAALALSGLRRRGPLGALMALAGGTVVARAAAGIDDMTRVRQLIEQRSDRWRRGQQVDETIEESFPASDAPSWTAGAGSSPSS